MTPLSPARQKMVEELVPSLDAIARGMGMADDTDVAYLAAVKAAAVWEDTTGGRATFPKYAKQCARFALMRHRKKEWKAHSAPLDFDPVDAERVDIERMIESLPEWDRKIFVAKFVMNVSIRTISIWMKVSPKKVYASLARSTDALRGMLEG